MSTQTHTPSPWKAEGNFFYALTEYLGPSRYAGKFPDGVNRFQGSVNSSGQEGASKEELEANARLIASAPQLLEALLDIKKLSKGKLTMSEEQAALDKMDAAIAIATGKEVAK